MKRNRIVLGVIAAVVVAYVISILPNLRHRAEWRRTVAALQSVPRERLSTAARNFARDQKVTDSTVPLLSLLSAGYLRQEDVQGLGEQDVAISLRANETTPSEVLIRVRASDGSAIVLLVDGSIQ